MRLCLAVAVLSSSLTAGAAAADPTFPYKARAATDGVWLRCGPGEKYYATERVPPGAEIEVYGHEQGWCKIRPVAGSCSWVSGRHLKLVAKGLGEVLSDGVPSQIGDRSGDIGTAIQVRLKRGEMVEVLGSKQVGSGGSATVWYKITPPSGEFRWIHGKYIKPLVVRERVARSSSGSNTSPRQTAHFTLGFRGSRRRSYLRLKREGGGGSSGEAAGQGRRGERASHRSAAVALDLRANGRAGFA